MSKPVVIVGAFDNLRSRDVRFVEEASKLGPVTALVYPDQTIPTQTGSGPRFPLAERLYTVQALRWVNAAIPMEPSIPPAALPQSNRWEGSQWVDQYGPFNEARQ